VGAYAVIYYTEPRYTKDLDIWIQPCERNAKKVYAALKEFGAPLQNISWKDFTSQNLVYQIGVAPVRVDIIMGIKGMNFDFAWVNRKRVTFEGIRTNIIGLKELIDMKRKTRREMDKRDWKELKYVWEKKRKK